MKPAKKITFMQVKETYDFTTGEVVHMETQTDWKVNVEPDFVKVYIDSLLAFSSVSKRLNPVLLEFLKYMSYAGGGNFKGGQTLFINIEMKRQIAQSTGLKLDRINQAITEFVKANIFKRVGTSTYQVNPHLFGKGDWKDIKTIRATFDFNTGQVRADIEKGIKPIRGAMC